jgi:exodeoxyribonuclease VII large subunit
MTPQFSFKPPAELDRPYSVSEINEGIAILIETGGNAIWVEGEISNFKQASSGHCYLRIKDEQSVIPAVIWRSTAVRLGFTPADGQFVRAIAQIKVYKKGGYYQLDIMRMQEAGAGALFAAFEKLKQKLEKEGLFDTARKRPVPRPVKRLGVITSKSGAAVRDIIKVVRKRAPSTEIVLCDVLVQGPKAPHQIADAVRTMNEYGNIDCIIVGRGGGSIEDLAAFNDEAVARAIHASQIPVISAVGHETDFTIADFVADLRAPTPSAAAEAAVPDIEESRRLFIALCRKLAILVKHRVSDAQSAIFNLSARLSARKPSRVIADAYQRCDELRDRQFMAIKNRIALMRRQLGGQCARLEALSPLAVLSRGYSVTFNEDGKIIKDSAALTAGDRISLRFSRGGSSAIIESVTLPKEA